MSKKFTGLITVFVCLALFLSPALADDTINDVISYEFKGAAAFSQTIGATAVSDKSTAYNSITRLTCTAHGYLAGSLVYLTGFVTPLDYLNGLRKINAIAANTLDVVTKLGTYVAGTPAGSETARCAIKIDEAFIFKGFELHLDIVGGATEDLEVVKDADAGVQFDTKIFDDDTATMLDEISIYGFLPCKKNDIIVATYANTNTRTWGLTFYIKKRY